VISSDLQSEARNEKINIKSKNKLLIKSKLIIKHSILIIKKKKRFINQWLVSVPLLMIILIIGDIIAKGEPKNYFNYVPISVWGWLGSRWLFFLIFSIIIIFWWKMLIPDPLNTVDYVKFLENEITIPSIDIRVAIFECNPPLINQGQELVFLISSFRPISFELRWKEASCFLILYGTTSPKFQLKVKECQKTLEACFTKVKRLKKYDLRLFFDYYLETDQKNEGPIISLNEQDNRTINCNQYFSNKTELKKIIFDLFFHTQDYAGNQEENQDIITQMWFVNRSNIVKRIKGIEDYYYGGLFSTYSKKPFFTINSPESIVTTVYSKLRITPKDIKKNSFSEGEENILYLLRKWAKVSEFSKSPLTSNINIHKNIDYFKGEKINGNLKKNSFILNHANNEYPNKSNSLVSQDNMINVKSANLKAENSLISHMNNFNEIIQKNVDNDLPNHTQKTKIIGSKSEEERKFKNKTYYC
jgi:hypothetical protein